jgi:hypothetical protein
MLHVQEKKEVYAEVWWEVLRERNHLEDLGFHGM